jgi:hypothetical protein
VPIGSVIDDCGNTETSQELGDASGQVLLVTMEREPDLAVDAATN